MTSRTTTSNEIPFTNLLRRVLAGLFIIGATSLASYSAYSYKQEADNLVTELSLQSQFLASNSQATFDSIGKSLSLVARAVDYSRSASAYRAPFQEIVSHHPEIVALFIWDAAGKPIYSTFGQLQARFRLDDATVGLDKSRQADARRVENYTIGRTGTGQVTHVRRIPIFYIVRSPRGQPQLILEASVGLERLTAQWARMPFMTDTTVGLLRDDLYHLARWPGAVTTDVYSRQIGLPELLGAARLHAPSGHYMAASPITHTIRVGAYARLPDLPLTAYVSVPKTTIWANWRKHNQPLLIASLFCAMAFILFAGLLLKREKRYRRALWEQASTDNLTELPSRIAAEDYLEKRIKLSAEQNSQFAVMFIDLDKFKDINDSMGHDCGDLVLKEVANRLRTVIRGRDLLARLGGDEFIAVISCSNILSAQRVAERMASVMRAPFYIDNRQFPLTLSIGISFYELGVSASQLMREADLAMYAIKNTTRNGYAFFNETMDEKVNKQVELQQQLLVALQRDEFRLHYQPKYNAAGEIVGSEALLRWQHPDLGLLSPGAFIRHAEESGMIVQIGEWVLQEACLQVKKWQAKDYKNGRVSVNVSARQFEQKGFVGQVANMISAAGINPALLEVEITESMLANDLEGMKRQLEELEQLGIAIALDDFGTGYSSLSYLRRFPIHSLKIDRSFVNDITTDPQDAELTNAIIAMGHALKIQVIAEGVETAEQLAYLRNRQCDVFQGYYLCKPVPAREMDQLLAINAASPMVPA